MLFEKLFRHRLLYHGLFWLTYVAVFTFTLNSADQHEFIHSLIIILMSTLAYIPAVYFNLLVLIPRFLINNRNLPAYFSFLLVTMLLGTPIVMANAHFLYNNIPSINQGEPFQWGVVGLRAAFGICLMVALTTGLKLGKDWFYQSQRTKDLEKQNLQSELKFLKSQVNPHFLFNTLNNLYSLTLKKDDKAPEIVLKLSDMMRYMLYECNERRVPLEKEISCLKNYIDLEAIRQGTMDVEFEVTGSVANKQVAPLIFITFLENSFKHGLNKSIGRGWVKVKLHVAGDTLHFEVSNDKPLNGKTVAKAGGIGLTNVQRRLNLLYPDAHELTITDQPNTFDVDLKLKLD